MVRALLLNAVDVPSTASCLMPDNGLASLAAVLVDGGHEVEICDPATLSVLRDHLYPEERETLRRLADTLRTGRVSGVVATEMALVEQLLESTVHRVYARLHEQLDRKLSRKRTDLLGIKLWFGPALREAMQVAESLVSRHPRLRIFVGGPMATLMPERLLQEFGAVEAVCVGEGEETISALAEHCDRGLPLSGIPNLVTRNGSGFDASPRSFPDLGRLPRPTYLPDIYPAMSGEEKLPVIYVDDSRGCPRRCPFCGHRAFSGAQRRQLPASRVVAHMKHWHHQLGARAFRFTGSSTPEPLYRKIADLLLEEPAKFLYSGFAHLDSWQSPDYARLRRSGLAALFVGIESASRDLLRGGLGKALNPVRLGGQISACMAAGIFVCGSVIFPAPGETLSTEQETFRFLVDLFGGHELGAVPVQPAFPTPYSEWWDHLRAYGFEADRAALLADLLRRRARRFVAPGTDPLPYRLDGLPFSELSAKSARFVHRLRERGVVTGMSDETVLIALAAGYSPREFQRIDREIFILGDADRMAEIIRRVRLGGHAEQDDTAGPSRGCGRSA